MAKQNRVPLEDLMVAMDVVDTLRHREIMVDRELNAVQRRAKLVEKLREIYASQGIEVTDEMLEEGVRALEEERFVFTPAAKSFSTWLAKIYVRRDRWMKPLVTLLGAGVAAGTFYYVTSVRPVAVEKAHLPIDIKNTYVALVKTSNDSKATQIANALNDEAQNALKSGDVTLAREKLEALNGLLVNLKQNYTVQIVQGSGKRSGIWRVPPGSTYGKNYYLIVEGVNAQGKKVTVQMQNEENDKRTKVKHWGIRVNEETFNRVSQDKSDDGIIQDRVVGVKNSGYLLPLYTVSTTGASITQW
jgi:hypothetical protein